LNRKEYLLIAIAFLLYPPLAGCALSAVHPGNLAIPLLFGAFLAVERKRSIWFATLAILSAASWEASLLSVPFLGLWTAISRPMLRRSNLVQIMVATSEL